MNDFCSEEFDALVALESGQVADWLRESPGYQRAVLLDRVEQCRSLLEKPYKLLGRVKVDVKKTGSADASTSTRDSGPSSVRVQGSLAKIGTGLAEKGPLARLRDWVGRRVRVRIRERTGREKMEEVRGEVIAMDKHFNLILRHAERVGLGGSGERLSMGQVLLRGETIVWVARWTG